MDGNFWPIVQFTAWQSSLVTLLSVVVGGGWAVLERHRHVQTPKWFIAMCTLPLFLPPLIVGTGFIHLLGQSGDVNNLLQWLNLPTVQFLYQPRSIVLAHLYYNLPLAYLMVRTALSRVSQHTIDAARVMGAKPWLLFTTIWWPNMRSAILGVAAMIMLYCWTSFSLPLQLGGSRAKTLEVWLYEQIKLYQQPELAWGVIAIQALIFLIPIWLTYRELTQPVQRFVPALQHARRWLNIGYLLFGLILTAPLFSLIIHTATQMEYRTVIVLVHSAFFLSLLRSLSLMVIVVACSTLLAFILRRQARWILLLLTLSPVAIGLIWLRLFEQNLFSLTGAFVFSLLPLATYLLHQATQQLPTSLVEAAKTLGTNYWQRLWLQYRWLLPSLQQIAAIGAVLVLGDVALANLLATTQQPTVMQVAYGLLGSYQFAVGSLAMCLLLVVILWIQLLIYYLPYARFGKR